MKIIIQILRYRGVRRPGMDNPLQKLPLITQSVILLCVAFYLVSFFLPQNILASHCLSPYLISTRLTLWGLVTSPFFHRNILHLFFNMMAFGQLGAILERDLFGSMQFLFLQFYLIVMGTISHFLLTGFLAITEIWPEGWYHCSMGYSGVIFGLLTLYCHLGERPFSFLGLRVPAWAYPWVLILFTQLLLSHISLMGHISGVLAAYAYIYRISRFLLPTPNQIHRLEYTSWVRFLTDRQSYVWSPFQSLPAGRSTAPDPSPTQSWWDRFQDFCTQARHVTQPSASDTTDSSCPRATSPTTYTENQSGSVVTLSRSPTNNASPPSPPAPKSFTGKGYRLSDPVNPQERTKIEGGFPEAPPPDIIKSSHKFAGDTP